MRPVALGLDVEHSLGGVEGVVEDGLGLILAYPVS
jgi:hypothetical protein